MSIDRDADDTERKSERNNRDAASADHGAAAVDSETRAALDAYMKVAAENCAAMAALAKQ